jgi:sensor histidine kinase YesM
MFSGGIGLSNTRARLQQFYGANFRFELESANGHGLLVTLCLPSKIKAEHQI